MLRFRSKLGLGWKFKVSLYQGIIFVVQDFWVQGVGLKQHINFFAISPTQCKRNLLN
jgi:hypothetical protein